MRVRIAVAIAVASLLVPPALAAAQVEVEGGDGAGTVAEALGLQELPEGADVPEAIVVVQEDETGRPEVVRYEAPEGLAADHAVAALDQDPSVMSAEIDGTYSIVPPAELAPAGGGAPAAADPYRFLQWQLDNANAEAGWTHDASGQVVAVLDTGVDSTHPDKGSVLPGVDFTVAGNPATTSDNGYHGTFVAGMVTAAANNGIGIAPTVRDVTILPGTVCGLDGKCKWSDTAEGIFWAVDEGASVINLSLGGPEWSLTLLEAIDYALDHDVVVVASAGNEALDGNPVLYPAAYDGVIGVGATTEADARASFSSYGSWVDIAAPGDDVLSLYNGGYAWGSGTSFSAPMVAGAAALVRQLDPDATYAEVAAYLTATARDVHSAGYDIHTGHGVLDFGALVPAALAGTPPAAPINTPPPAPPPPPKPKLPTCPPGGVTHDQVCRLYIAFFNRVPDKAGHNAWVAQRFAGMSIADVAEAFAQSSEFKSKYGSISSGGFVDLVYQNVLGRAADAAGRSHWTAQLASGASRGYVMAAFSESGEYIKKTNTRPWRDWVTLQIERLYRAYFLRDADAQGLAQWVAVRMSGVSLDAVSEQFAQSAEFRNRYGNLTNAQFVHLVYQNVLGRAPDGAGSSYWVSQLGAGVSRGSVMTGFSESGEFVQKTKTQP